MSTTIGRSFTAVFSVWVMTLASGAMSGSPVPEPQQTLAEAAKIVGPEEADDACSVCHYLEAEAWRNTRHFATFSDRHSSPRALEILKAMGERTMKRSGACLSCHYTSLAKGDQLVPTWGVSCESCHGAAQDWVTFHNRPGGDPAASAMKYATGKDEAPASRQARLGAMTAKGGITSANIYEIAANCYGCHTVPNEALVNKGGHRAGSDFDLVAWSQGEIRHNFVSSPGAPATPTNRPATDAQRRRLYVVGTLVDLEVSLRNLAAVAQKGGAFHTAMVERVNRMRAKIDAVLNAVPLPEVASALGGMPKSVTADTAVPVAMIDALRDAARRFAANNDGSGLAAIDGLIPKEVKGTVHKP